MGLSRSGNRKTSLTPAGPTARPAVPAVPEDAVRQEPVLVEDQAVGVQGVGAGAPGVPGVEPPWQLTGSWLQRARDELHEDPDTNHVVLQRLRDLIREDSELRARTDDPFLIRFLRARKFNVAKAHRTVQRYYHMKHKHPNLFRVDNLDRLSTMMGSEMHGVLQGKDSEGCPVLTVKIDNYDSSVHSVDDYFRLNIAALEHMVRDPETQVSGLTVIVDLTGFGMQHAPFLSPFYVKTTSEVVQESFPLRFKGFHVVNQPFYFAAIFAMVKPFLKEKIKRRVVLHGSRLASLHKVIPVDILPQRYGGPPGAFEYQRWTKAVQDLAEYFSYLESFGYPEGEGTREGSRRRLSLPSLRSLGLGSLGHADPK